MSTRAAELRAALARNHSCPHARLQWQCWRSSGGRVQNATATGSIPCRSALPIFLA
jgi:hypothetical protein